MEKIDHKSIYNENEIQSKYNKTIYDTIFIGGGPSTLSFISYLFKNNQIDKFIKERNILILEKNNFFGSGCLGKFGINSNTSAEGFVRLICQGTDSKDSKTKTNLSPDKANKQKDLTPMKMFQELFNTKIAQSLLSIGSKVAPLNLIGEFLQTTGNFILTILKSIFNKEIFIGESEVQLVKQLKNPTEYEIYFTKNKNTYRVKTKALVLASGAKQKFDQKTKQIILNYIEPEGFFNSDYVLQEQGFDKLYNYIKPKKKRKVVIIGGSHSGFSCAWILLNSSILKFIDAMKEKLIIIWKNVNQI